MGESDLGKEEKKVISGDLNLQINLDEIKKIKKQYKKLKKYMRSSIYTVSLMDNKEKVVTRLIKDQEDNPA